MYAGMALYTHIPTDTGQLGLFHISSRITDLAPASEVHRIRALQEAQSVECT